MNQLPKEPPWYTSVPLITIRRAAVDAQLDERTVLRLVMGLPTRPAGRERALAALERQGVDITQIKQPVPNVPAGEAETPESPKVTALIAEKERLDPEFAALRGGLPTRKGA